MIITLYPEAKTAVGTGDTDPDFALQNKDGTFFNLRATMQKQPVVLVPYRGDWCDWCQLQTAPLR